MSLRASGARRSTWLLVLIFLLSLPAVTTRFYASDEVETFSWLRSWWFDHDVNFQNEYEHFYDAGVTRDAGFHETFLELSNEAGRRYNFAPIGSAVLWTPFFAAGDLVAHVTGAPADGYSAPYIDAVAYGSAIYGFAGVLLTIAIVRRVVGGGLGATIAVWVGTPLIFYMYVAPGFAHACSAFAVSLFLWTWLRVRDRWTPGGAVALGLTGALMAIVREQDLLFVAGPAIDFLRAWATSAPMRPGAASARPHSAGGVPGTGAEANTDGAGHVAMNAHARTTFVAAALAGAVAFLAGYAPQLLAYKALNGHFGPTNKVLAKMTWSSPHFFQVLLSPEHGLFVWTPLAIVAICGLARLAAAAPRAGALPDVRWIAVVAIVMFALQVYVNGSIESWTVAGSFGQRRFVAITPLLALGLAALVPAGRGAAATAGRALWTIVVLACVWWNLGLMAQFGLHTMDRQRLSIADNARATFVTLPTRAPALAWRYLFARATLFGLPRQ